MSLYNLQRLKYALVNVKRKLFVIMR